VILSRGFSSGSPNVHPWILGSAQKFALSFIRFLSCMASTTEHSALTKSSMGHYSPIEEWRFVAG